MAEKKYTVEPFSVEKIMSADGALLNKYVELINCLFEVDITEIRQKVKEARSQNKQELSVLACLLYCYGQTLHKFKESYALRGKGNKLYFFDEADAFFPVDIRIGDKKLLWCKIIKGINLKSPYELEQDIRAAKAMTKTITKAEKIFFAMPFFVRNWYYNYMMGNPLVRKGYGGNVYFTSMIHRGNADFLLKIVPQHFHTTGMFVGTYKQQTDNNGIEKSILGITLSLDHIISDADLLAKLAREFVNQVDNFKL